MSKSFLVFVELYFRQATQTSDENKKTHDKETGEPGATRAGRRTERLQSDGREATYNANHSTTVLPMKLLIIFCKKLTN